MAIGYKEQSSASVPVPPSGAQYTFIDTSDGKLKRKNASGVVTDIEAGGGGGGGAVSSVNGQTGTVVLTASDVGLGSVNNTSDADKPISTAVATALSGKYDASNPSNFVDATAAAAAAPVQSVAGKTGTVTLDKSDVGLGSVDNTADADKPISNAVQDALDTISGDVTGLDGRVTTLEGKHPVDLQTDVTGTLPAANGGTGRTDFPATQMLFGAPDGLSIDRSEFFTYDASIGLLLNVGGQMQTRSLEQAATDPTAIVINDKIEVSGDDGTGPAYTRIKRDYLEAKKVLPTKELSASAGFDGTHSWLGVSETTNSGNNISMAKIFPNKAQLFTVDIGLGNGPQPILPVEPYDLTTKAYVDSVAGSISSTDDLPEGTTNLYYSDLRVANSPAVLGIQNAVSSIPTGTATSTTAATAASTTFVDVMSTTVTLYQTTTIYGVAMADLKATTAAAVAGFRVMINGVAGQTMSVNLADTTNNYPVLAQYFSATLAAGTYTVKAQMNRVSGTGTVNFSNGTLWSQAQQGAVIPVSPSRMYYVSKNGGASPSADGSWSRPFSTISAAVNAAIAAGADYNQPYAIAVAPGVGSTTYSETAPINITKGGICIFAMASPGYKGIQTSLSGNFVVNMAGSNLFFTMFGIEINCPATAAFTATPAALYVTGTATQRVFVDSCVLNANSASAGAVFCDNPSATIQVSDSDVKAGTSAGPNVSAAKISAGNLILKGVEGFNRQSGNVGAFAEVGGGSLTVFGGSIQGYINKTSNSSNIQIFSGTSIASGSSASIQTQATAGTGTTIVYDAAINSTASNVVTGGENFNCGTITYSNTGSGLDSALNSGAGPIFLAFDGRPKFYATTPSQWATVPANMNEAINRLASAVYAATANTPIP